MSGCEKVLKKELCNFLVDGFSSRSHCLKKKREIFENMKKSQKCAENVTKNIIKILGSIRLYLEYFEDRQLSSLLFFLREIEDVKLSPEIKKGINTVKNWSEWDDLNKEKYIGVGIYTNK